MSNSVVIHQVSISDLKKIVGDAVAEQLGKTNPQNDPKQLTILTRQQAADMLGITLPTLHSWTKRGVLQGVRIGSLVRYRLSDIDTALKDIRHIKYSRK